MLVQVISVLAIFTVWSSSVSASTDKIVCYFGSWSTYRSGNGKFDVENINPHLCTHAIYAFIGINYDGTIKVMDYQNDVTKGAFLRFTNMKKQNPHLKTLVAIGGWNEGVTGFSTVAASSALRVNFLSSALTFMQTYGFDGFDFDWEYPAQRGGDSRDKENFIQLLSEFRQTFAARGYILSAAVAATGTSVDISYDVPSLCNHVDFINVMTYDYHAAWDGVTGENAPLYPSPEDPLLNVDSSIKGWISRGANPAKLILGTGAYGRSFTLNSATNNGIGAQVTGVGAAGPFTQEAGMLGYNEICTCLLTEIWTVVWNDVQQVPYAYRGNQWIGYDNEKSIAIKASYAKNMGLGGVMVWSIDMDDFLGKCGSPFPLLNTIKNILELTSTVPENETTSIRPSSVTQSSSIKTSLVTESSSTGVCTSSGYFRDPVNCSKYYYCLLNGSTYKKLELNCPEGLVYDVQNEQCVYPSGGLC